MYFFYQWILKALYKNNLLILTLGHETQVIDIALRERAKLYTE